MSKEKKTNPVSRKSNKDAKYRFDRKKQSFNKHKLEPKPAKKVKQCIKI